MIGLIVAYTKHRVIGSEGRIPWRNSAVLRSLPQAMW